MAKTPVGDVSLNLQIMIPKKSPELDQRVNIITTISFVKNEFFNDDDDDGVGGGSESGNWPRLLPRTPRSHFGFRHPVGNGVLGDNFPVSANYFQLKRLISVTYFYDSLLHPVMCLILDGPFPVSFSLILSLRCC